MSMRSKKKQSTKRCLYFGLASRALNQHLNNAGAMATACHDNRNCAWLQIIILKYIMKVNCQKYNKGSIYNYTKI